MSRKIQMRNSPVHGRGIFALQPIKKGTRIIEYKGEIITWKQAIKRHPHDPSQPNHTFYFHLDEKHVIDGLLHGNWAKWINHSCAPNCESEAEGQRIYIKALKNIKTGEELNFDYALSIDARYTAKLKREFACFCGSKKCRGTMLAPKK